MQEYIVETLLTVLILTFGIGLRYALKIVNKKFEIEDQTILDARVDHIVEQAVMAVEEDSFATAASDKPDSFTKKERAIGLATSMLNTAGVFVPPIDLAGKVVSTVHKLFRR